MTRRTRASALVLVVALVAAVASSTGASAARTRAKKGDTQGVTDTEIRVGGVGGYSVNPVNLPYDQMVDGVNAYFAMINEEEGGVFGRELKVVKNRDDRSQSITDLLATRALNETDKVFAIIPVVTTGFTTDTPGQVTVSVKFCEDWCGLFFSAKNTRG